MFNKGQLSKAESGVACNEKKQGIMNQDCLQLAFRGKTLSWRGLMKAFPTNDFCQHDLRILITISMEN